jgi:uncharacterized protein YciI
MARPFVIIRSRGPAWEDGKPLEEQVGWSAHAAFMDALVAERFIVLGGPLEGSRDVVLIARAEDADEIAKRLEEDPWARSGHTILKECRPWRIRLGTLP